MAIFRWNGEGSLTNIASWYNSVDHGCPIRVSFTNPTMKIMDPTSYGSIYVTVYASNSTNATVLATTGLLQQSIKIFDSWNNYGGFYIYGAIVCSNGILFKTYGRINTSSYGTYYDFGFALDKFGYLVLLTRVQISDSYARLPADSSCYDWQVIGINTPTISPTLKLKPHFGAERTALSPIIPCGSYSGSEGNFLPNAYFGTQTQLSGMGLTAVRINGVDYITNGVIYIRDTPAE